MKRQIILTFAFAVAVFAAKAQIQDEEPTPLEKVQQTVEVHDQLLNKLNAFKFSGYLQPQFQLGQQAASLKVGTANENPNKSFNRMGIRRGRLKLVYDDGSIATGTIQLNIVDKSNASGVSQAVVQLKEAFLNVKDPWTMRSSIQAGVFDRPFGNEISYSSSLLESPERSRIIQTLFPEECDLGAKVTLQTKANSPLSFIKLDAGFFAGNAINPETDNRKDFIGHIAATKPIGNTAKWGLGASYYNGGVYQGSNNVYTFANGAWTKSAPTDNSNIGKFAKREYFGFDGQFSFESKAGFTQLRAEYIWGTQPGTAGSTSSPNRSALTTDDTYLRKTSGWYAILIQDLGKSPFSAVVKYDVYDPNTKIKKDQIGLNGTTKAEIAYNTLGVGALWRINPAVRLQLFYEMVKNEKTANIAAYTGDQKDNVFTARLQFKF
ncbi:MAG: hypothetical protein BGN96_05345 [Bacteroidales bacterium 45-6]|nr:MAG: hypothetical protein BGN96_05345 [Bacteroidales bacterium 45-6]